MPGRFENQATMGSQQAGKSHAPRQMQTLGSVFVVVLSALQERSGLLGAVFHQHVFNNSFPLPTERLSLKCMGLLLHVCRRRPPICKN